MAHLRTDLLPVAYTILGHEYPGKNTRNSPELCEVWCVYATHADGLLRRCCRVLSGLRGRTDGLSGRTDSQVGATLFIVWTAGTVLETRTAL